MYFVEIRAGRTWGHRPLLVVLAVALAGCASEQPKSAAVPPSTVTAEPGAGNASAKAERTALRGYEKVVRNGQTYYCHKTGVTGSLFEQETCLTQAQIDQRAQDVQRLEQDIRHDDVVKGRQAN